MRIMPPWLTGLVILIGPAPSVLAQIPGTCEAPIFVNAPSGSGPTEFDLDTGLWANLENGECADSLATGPDVVFDFDGMSAIGEVRWVAEFPAVVYVRRDSCDAVRCQASTSGSLGFDCGWRWEGPPGDETVTWDYLAIIVDGLNGAAGHIHLTFDFFLEIPVCEDSWGRIKRRFR